MDGLKPIHTSPADFAAFMYGLKPVPFKMQACAEIPQCNLIFCVEWFCNRARLVGQGFSPDCRKCSKINMGFSP
jgi:hypothetical protein